MVSETVGTVDGIRVTALTVHSHQSFGSTAPIPVTEFAVVQPAARFVAAMPMPCSLEVLARDGLDGEEAVVRSPTIVDTKRHSFADSLFI